MSSLHMCSVITLVLIFFNVFYRCPIGNSLQADIRQLNIKCKRIKMNQLYEAPPGESSATTPVA